MHVFLQEIAERRVVDRSQRAEEGQPSVGEVLEAPYLCSVQRSLAPRGWFVRLFAWLGVGQRLPARPRAPLLRFRLPFTTQGGDALGLFQGSVPQLGPDDDASSGIRCARGRAVSLQGTKSVLFSDFWLVSEGLRLTQGQDFALVAQNSAVIISCGLAPLIIAKPQQVAVADLFANWPPRLRALRRDGVPDGVGWEVVVREGDEVEVLGVVRPLRESQRSFQFGALRDAYRGRPVQPTQVLGDEDGTRLVLRVVA